jgi:hypothetical protein
MFCTDLQFWLLLNLCYLLCTNKPSFSLTCRFVIPHSWPNPRKCSAPSHIITCRHSLQNGVQAEFGTSHYNCSSWNVRKLARRKVQGLGSMGWTETSNIQYIECTTTVICKDWHHRRHNVEEFSAAGFFYTGMDLTITIVQIVLLHYTRISIYL